MFIIIYFVAIKKAVNFLQILPDYLMHLIDIWAYTAFYSENISSSGSTREAVYF